jgi:ubiquinone/menaquinone biosynthesis C-methylase UbiE
VDDGRHAGRGSGDPVIAVWAGLAVAGAVGLGALIYWQLIVAEGTYLGPRVVAKTYDWISRRYDAIKQFHTRDESWFVAAPLLGELAGVKHPLILDVATGTGRLPLDLLREHFVGQIVGLDLSTGMLRQARTKLEVYEEQVSLIWQDASHLPFEDDTFDAVTSLESLEFLPQPRAALAEMVRVLAPGGVLFLTNRVGREARFLPGRAIPRTAFRQALRDLRLSGIQVRPWQVAYDLVLARKAGHRDPHGRGGAALSSLVRCSVCRGPLQDAPFGLVCSDCETTYPLRDGIVYMADAKPGDRRSRISDYVPNL